MTQLKAEPEIHETLVPEPPPPVTLTEKAAEMVKQAMEQEKLESHGLRVGVTGGGCSGLQYLLDFAEQPTDEDFVSESHGVRLLVDQYSAMHLTGTVIDYVDGIHGSGFKFDNPHVIRTCGCSGAH